ncbi:uncharacterized protein LOC144345463 [Saccoglossus kowalevskii]
MSLDAEINPRIGKATGVRSKLTKRVWENKILTLSTKLKVYHACVLSTLLYSSETWVTYTNQEAKLNFYHMRCLRRQLGIIWEDKITNCEVLSKAKTTSIFAMLSQRRLCWLGHVSRMDKGRLPKDLLYGQLEEETRPVGRPCLRFSDVCKRDLRATHIDTQSWEITAGDRSTWRQAYPVLRRLKNEQTN